MDYQLYMFDFDGTLADIYPWFSGIFNGLAKKYGFKPVSKAEEDTLRSMNIREIFAYIGLPIWRAPLIAADVRMQMKMAIGDIQLFDDIGTLLNDVARSGAEIAIISSNTENNVRAVLGEPYARLINYFACGASIFGKSGKISHVIKQSGCEPTNAIYIGDEIRDIAAAKKNNVVAGAVVWGYNSVDAIRTEQPDRLFYTVRDIH